MKPLKQCNLKWANKKLGTGNICDRGCVVTASAMLAQTTPDKIVDEASFTASGAIYWQTLKSLKFHWRGYKYENDKVLKAIKDYGGCLVEVNMPSAPGGKHWVLFIGDGKMNDPLTGKTESTSKYTPTGYCILEPIKKEENTDTMQIKKETFEKLVTKATKFDRFKEMGYDKPEKVKENIEKLIQDHKKCELAKRELGDKIRDARERIQSLEENLGSCEASKAQHKGRADRLADELKLCQARPVKTDTTLDAKILKLIGYLALSGGIGYVLSTYVANDPELFKYFTPTANLILYLIEKRIKALQAETGLEKTDK